MKGSFRLARLAGIDIKLHFTFPLILIWGAVQWAAPHGAQGALFGALLMAAVFVCVALHEMGHALTARWLGIPVREIVLLPIGGVAMLARNPRTPVHELLIAVAGPLVNVGIALALGTVLLVQGGPTFWSWPGEAGAGEPSLQTALIWLLGSNILLALFNLVPAFPMDGGRILRAVLAMVMDFQRATRITAALGQFLAVVVGAWALFNGQIVLAVVALFVFLGASGERAAEEARGILSTLRLRDAYNKHALTLQPADRVSHVIDYLLTSYQPDFAVLHGGRLLGVVTRAAALRSMMNGLEAGEAYVTSVMDREVLVLDGRLTLAEAQEAMAEAGAAVAAVFEDERFLGLVSLEDLSEALQIAAFLQEGAARKPGPQPDREAA